jgi:hypothetical protein
MARVIRQPMMKGAGFESSMEITRQPKSQWYKADGTPLPNLLPTDDYHLMVFRAKGWTLTPPQAEALLLAKKKEITDEITDSDDPSEETE